MSERRGKFNPPRPPALCGEKGREAGREGGREGGKVRM